MSKVVLDHIIGQNSPISPPSRPFLRSAILNNSSENVLNSSGSSGGEHASPSSGVASAIPQSISRPNSRRSSRMFTNNLPPREDSLGSSLHYFGINPSVWDSSPIVCDSPTTSIRSRAPSNAIQQPPPLQQSPVSKATTTGFSYGVSSIGRSFDWNWTAEPTNINEYEYEDEELDEPDTIKPLPPISSMLAARSLSLDLVPSMSSISSKNSQKLTLSLADGMLIPHNSPTPLTRPTTPAVSLNSAGSIPGSPRFRRRSSQKQFSLVAGRLHYTPPPSPPPDSSSEIPIRNGLSAPGPKLLRLASTSSFMSVNSVVVGPPTPGKVHYAGDRSISEFVLQGDVGRGAYGLVKRGREVMADGSYGVRDIRPFHVFTRLTFPCSQKSSSNRSLNRASSPIAGKNTLFMVQSLLKSTLCLPFLPQRMPYHRHGHGTQRASSTPLKGRKLI